MSKLNCLRKGCKDVFHSFLVEIEQTKKNLRKYEKLLKEYYRRMYYGY